MTDIKVRNGLCRSLHDCSKRLVQKQPTINSDFLKYLEKIFYGIDKKLPEQLLLFGQSIATTLVFILKIFLLKSRKGEEKTLIVDFQYICNEGF